ncbi:MAG: hypothetical protein AAGI07_11065 [Bacteroidota bacterium]
MKTSIIHGGLLHYPFQYLVKYTLLKHPAVEPEGEFIQITPYTFFTQEMMDTPDPIFQVHDMYK